MMPAKGGNPFLTDQQIGHLVAFVKSLPNSEAPAAAAGGEGGPPPEQLSRWVVPPPASPQPGLLELSPERDWIDTAAWQRIASERRTAQIKALGLSAITVHGLFLLGLVGISSHLVFGWLLQVRIPQVHGFLALLTVGWLCALVAWLVVLWLFPSG
jgi:hypothetical protein